MQSLRGKVALITGASSGIGAAIAEYFANHGVRLSLAGRKPDNLNAVAIKTNLGKSDILTTVGDMVKDEDRRQLVGQTMDKFGKLDILVNNAGIVNFDLLENLQEEHYDTLMDINLKAPVMLAKLAIPHLVKSKGSYPYLQLEYEGFMSITLDEMPMITDGEFIICMLGNMLPSSSNIVNISSNASDILAKELGAYNISKVGLDAFTKVLAAELGPRGVRVNSLNSGFAQSTNILQRSNVKNIKETVEHFSSSSAFGRAATPEEIAQVAAFLASDLASFVTGELLYADGGMRLRN